MFSIEKQFGVGMAALAGAAFLTGVIRRRLGDSERERRYGLHYRDGGEIVEVDVHAPPNAQRGIVLINGLGTPHECWDWVCSHLPDDVAYVKYNRPGYGLSTPALTNSLDGHANLLDELVDEYLPGLPVTLVGHSLGGYLAAAYAEARRDSGRPIQRLVLVDATNIAQLREFDNTPREPWVAQMMLLEQVWTVMGLSALRPAMNRQRTYRLPVNRTYRDFTAHRSTWTNAYREYQAAKQYPEITEVGVPLDVISAYNRATSGNAHRDSQAQLLKLSEDSRHHLIENADHESIIAVNRHARRLAGHITETMGEMSRS